MKKIEIHGMGEDQEVLRKLENEFFINVIKPPLTPKECPFRAVFGLFISYNNSL